MTQAQPEAAVDEAQQGLHASFEEFEVLSTSGVDVFVLDLNHRDDVPPFYIFVDGRRFALRGETFQVVGHGARLPQYVREEEEAGHLVLLAERGERYLVYVHDPVAEAEEAEEAAQAETEGGDGAANAG